MSNCSAACSPIQTRGLPQNGQSFSASVRSWISVRRSRCSGRAVRPCGSRLDGVLSVRGGGGGRRSERWPKRCFRAASSLARNSAFSMLSLAFSLRSSAFSLRSWVFSARNSPSTTCSGDTLSTNRGSQERAVASMPDETPSTRQGSAMVLIRSILRKPFETSDARQIDAFEDHLKLAHRQLDRGRRVIGLREVIAAGFEPLAPQAQAMTSPIENLETIGATIAKDEQVAGQRVGLQARTDQREQTVEAQPHIDGIGAVPELDGRREGQHGETPSSCSRQRSVASSAPAAMRTSVPPGKTSSIGAAGSWKQTGSSRGAASWGAGLVFSAASRRFQR